MNLNTNVLQLEYASSTNNSRTTSDVQELAWESEPIGLTVPTVYSNAAAYCSLPLRDDMYQSVHARYEDLRTGDRAFLNARLRTNTHHSSYQPYETEVSWVETSLSDPSAPEAVEDPFGELHMSSHLSGRVRANDDATVEFMLPSSRNFPQMPFPLNLWEAQQAEKLQVSRTLLVQAESACTSLIPLLRILSVLDSRTKVVTNYLPLVHLCPSVELSERSVTFQGSNTDDLDSEVCGFFRTIADYLPSVPLLRVIHHVVQRVGCAAAISILASMPVPEILRMFGAASGVSYDESSDTQNQLNHLYCAFLHDTLVEIELFAQHLRIPDCVPPECCIVAPHCICNYLLSQGFKAASIEEFARHAQDSDHPYFVFGVDQLEPDVVRQMLADHTSFFVPTDAWRFSQHEGHPTLSDEDHLSTPVQILVDVRTAGANNFQQKFVYVTERFLELRMEAYRMLSLCLRGQVQIVEVSTSFTHPLVDVVLNSTCAISIVDVVDAGYIPDLAAVQPELAKHFNKPFVVAVTRQAVAPSSLSYFKRENGYFVVDSAAKISNPIEYLIRTHATSFDIRIVSRINDLQPAGFPKTFHHFLFDILNPICLHDEGSVDDPKRLLDIFALHVLKRMQDEGLMDVNAARQIVSLYAEKILPVAIFQQQWLQNYKGKLIANV